MIKRIDPIERGEFLVFEMPPRSATTNRLRFEQTSDGLGESYESPRPPTDDAMSASASRGVAHRQAWLPAIRVMHAVRVIAAR